MGFEEALCTAFRTVWGDNQIRGRSVLTELAGKTTWWSHISLALGHRILDAQECGVLDDISGCFLAADPRIWPLKVVRLTSSFGGAVPGICAGLLGLEGTMGGPSDNVPRAAQIFRDVDEALGERAADSEAVKTWVDEQQAKGLPFVGFGVHYRPYDERVMALTQCLERRGRAEMKYWRLAFRIEEALGGIKLNISGAVAAAVLDLGFPQDKIRFIGPTIILAAILGNAAEGVAQAPDILRCLPESAVRYEGVPPRPSPRKTEAK